MKSVNIVFFSLMLCCGAVAEEGALEDVAVMALSPIDSQAVIKLPDAKMQVLKVGEKIQGINATLVQVLGDRLVFEKAPTKAGGAVEVVWLYRAEQGVSRVEYVKSLISKKMYSLKEKHLLVPARD